MVDYGFNVMHTFGFHALRLDIGIYARTTTRERENDLMEVRYTKKLLIDNKHVESMQEEYKLVGRTNGKGRQQW